MPTPGDVDAACWEARRARETLERSHEALRVTRRQLVDLGRALEVASRDAERTAIAAHKAELADAWRTASEAATDEAGRQDATGAWMQRISERNRRTRAAVRQLGVGRQQVAVLEARLRTGELETAAIRIRAEAAEAACTDARRRRAAAEERVIAAGAAERVAAAGAGGSAVGAVSGTSMDASAAGEPVPGDGDHRAGRPDDSTAERPAGTGTREPGTRAPGTPKGPRAADSDTVRRLLAGDAATHHAVANELAEMSGQLPARYLLLLDAFVDELGGAALDAGSIVVDQGHALWSQFSPEGPALVIRGLRDLGFQLDLHDGWYGGRAPTTSDLASAMGFAGYDVRALRGLPSAAELRALPLSVQVATHDHLRRMAPDLTLDQVALALGPRASGLGDLWDEWGRVRPLLSEALPTPA